MKRTSCYIAFLLSAATASVAQSAEFRASNGEVLRAPDIETLTCADRGTLLLEYTVSGYRETEPVAEGHPDRPIYEYENQLAQAYYMQCQVGASHFRDSAPAFSSGFN